MKEVKKIEWTEKDIIRGLECICKLDLLLDDITYFQSRGIMYKTMKQKASVLRDEMEKHIGNFFKISSEEAQLEYYKKIEELRLKLKI